MICCPKTKSSDYLSEATRDKINSLAVLDDPVTYGIVEERYFLICGHHARISYGIAAYADIEADATLTIVASAHDISSDRLAIAEIADLCNRLKLPPAVLRDVVEAFLDS